MTQRWDPNNYGPNNPFGLEQGPPTAQGGHGEPIEKLWGPNPTNPNRGPYIGRSIEISAGQLGQAVFDSGQCNIGDMLTICLTQSDFPISGATGQDPDARTARMALVGTIQWRVGQHQDQCDVDWIRGTLLTIPSGNITINCSYPVDVAAAVTQPRQQVGVLCAPLIRPGGLGVMPLARLTKVLAAPLGVGVRVPRRAQAFSLLLTDPTKYGAVVIQEQYNAEGIGGADFIAAVAPPDGRENVLPNGCRSLLVTGAGTDAVIVFSIAI